MGGKSGSGVGRLGCCGVGASVRCGVGGQWKIREGGKWSGSCGKEDGGGRLVNVQIRN